MLINIVRHPLPVAIQLFQRSPILVLTKLNPAQLWWASSLGQQGDMAAGRGLHGQPNTKRLVIVLHRTHLLHLVTPLMCRPEKFTLLDLSIILKLELYFLNPDDAAFKLRCSHEGIHDCRQLAVTHCGEDLLLTAEIAFLNTLFPVSHFSNSNFTSYKTRTVLTDTDHGGCSSIYSGITQTRINRIGIRPGPG